KGLVRKRLRGVNELLDGGDALVRGLHRLHGVRFSVQKVAEVRSAALEGLRGEEAVRIVERRVDLLARRETVRGLREEFGSVLEREQVLTHASGESNITHSSSPFLGWTHKAISVLEIENPDLTREKLMAGYTGAGICGRNAA